MSLFGILDGQSDVWSLNGISFAWSAHHECFLRLYFHHCPQECFLNTYVYGFFCFSVINDILERDVFTLEELLEEDELLQEVKSRNVKLIDL